LTCAVRTASRLADHEERRFMVSVSNHEAQHRCPAGTELCAMRDTRHGSLAVAACMLDLPALPRLLFNDGGPGWRLRRRTQ
jgi:hypothetical protein